MPGPSRWRGPALVHAVVANKVKAKQLNARVRNVLNLVDRGMKSGVAENATEHKLDRPEDRQLLRKVAAESIVLLKNDDNVLPLQKSRKIAVIGPNSKITTYCGGGSASLRAYYTVRPFDGIVAQAIGGVDFAQGCYGHQSLPQLGAVLKTFDGRKGFTMKVYNEPPGSKQRNLLEERLLTDAMIFFIDYSHPKLDTIWYADAEGIFTPEETGLYDFGICVQGTARLYIDGNLVVSNVENQRSGPSFLGSGTVEEVGTMEMVAGQQYRVLLQWGCAKTSTLKAEGVVDFGHGGFRFSGCKKLDPKESIKQATDLAKTVDQVVLFAGLSGEWETEGQDRDNMDLPPHTDDLISNVLKANPNTVVVIQVSTLF